MENLGEYDKITQSIQINRDVVEEANATGDGERFRRYILRELAVKMAEKLMKSGYITETWLRTEHTEECTIQIYVKPLLKSK